MRDEAELHEGRRLFGLDPEGYASGRPGYPEEVFDYLVERCGLVEGTATVEIGPGAGQATVGLIARGASPLVLIEPDPALARFVGERFGDRVEVRNEAFEDAALDPASFDLAVCATAFHWVDTKRGLAQAMGSLREGGAWAMWWTIFHAPEDPGPLYDALTPILTPVLGPASDDPAARMLDHQGRLGDLRSAGFLEPDSETVRWTLRLDAKGARALYGSFSPIRALAEPTRTQTLDGIERVVTEDFAGVFERTIVTAIYSGRRP